MMNVTQLIELTKTYFCLDCGVCTGSCPVARVYPDFSPRQIIERSLYGLEEPSDPTLWSCLTCAQCSVRCPANIDFPEFVRRMRDEAHEKGYDGTPAHNGMLQTITAMQALGIQQNRTSWIEPGQTTDRAGTCFILWAADLILTWSFGASMPGPSRAPKNVLKILNGCGVTPVVSNDEQVLRPRRPLER